jgi:hypothetical protein
MTFPEKIVDREKYIFDRVLAGTFEASWTTLSYAMNGKSVKLQIMEDALKIDGVRVNVSASLQQRLADVFDASLMTAQVADLVYVNATRRIDPAPMQISTSVASMTKHSSNVDVKLKALSAIDGLVADPGKHWILDKKLEQVSGRACNYGWHFTGSSYSGIAGFPVPTKINSLNSKSVKVIQPNATAHDILHSDYSQICQLVSQICWVDDVEKRFSDLLVDSTLASLVNHQGPLKIVRQPGIPLVQGLKVMFPTVISNSLPIV